MGWVVLVLAVLVVAGFIGRTLYVRAQERALAAAPAKPPPALELSAADLVVARTQTFNRTLAITGGLGVFRRASGLSSLKRAGATRIRFLCLVAAPEGVARLAKEHPDVPVLAAGLDRELNEHGYILPGLGDAGDRLFGTR